ncbi:MAG TPA: cell division protein FtsQ/DivIB [Ferrovibrio sp.]|jgi:cell division protein FtsQ|uniref:cell division protein FtsQ/DivIB n=1 Tax=Ferrovibrio sp. TaxID=1917215 RepID=UPI002ED11A89
MRSLVVLPEDRPCAPCAPSLPPQRPKGYCRPLPPARKRPPSVLWRRFRIGMALAGMAGLAGAGAYAWFRTDLPAQVSLLTQNLLGEAGAEVDLKVNDVNLTGRVNTPLKALVSAVGVERGDPILSLDLDAVRRRVEAIGWVKQATVWRQLPDTLHIEIVERQPFARWQIDGRIYLIDQEGRVLEEDDRPEFAHLLLLVGAGASDRAHDLMAMLQTDPVLARRVVNAVRVRGRRWDIQFDNGVVARLPEENPEQAWARLIALEQKEGLLRRDIQLVDLRLEDRLIVRLNPEAEPPTPVAAPAKKPSGKRT